MSVTVAAAIEQLKRIEFGCPFKAWGWSLGWSSPREANAFFIRIVSLRSPNRDTGEPGVHGNYVKVFPVCPDGTLQIPGDDILGAVRGMAREYATHEADESFLVDGKRAFDPHAAKEEKTE